MKLRILTTIVFLSLLLFSCFSTTQNKKEEASKNEENKKAAVVETTTSIDNEIQNTIKLENGFEILVGGEEDFNNFKTYTLFKLNRNGTEIFLDSSQTEYEFGDNFYPLILPLANDRFDLLVEVNDRPSKNYLKLLRIKGNKLINIEKLPTFISQAKNLDSDADLEFAGFWDYPQTSSNDNGLEITAYNPILYYQLSKKGLELDSALTIKRNTEIYRKFSGFEFKEAIEIPASTLAKHATEIKRLEK